MRDFVVNLVKEGAKEMYDTHGQVSPWRLSRNIHVSAGVIEECLAGLGFIKESTGNFILKKDQGKAKVKKTEPRRPRPISSQR